MADITILIQKIIEINSTISSMKDFAKYSIKNLNPRSFSIGHTNHTFSETEWFWCDGHNRAEYWNEYHNCILSSELVSFIEMHGFSKNESINIRDFLIDQGFYEKKFHLTLNKVKDAPCKYLLKYIGKE